MLISIPFGYIQVNHLLKESLNKLDFFGATFKIYREGRNKRTQGQSSKVRKKRGGMRKARLSNKVLLKEKMGR